MPPDDHPEPLVERAQAGDRPAFDELVRRTGDRLLHLISRRIGRALQHEIDAADVLQEALLRAFRSFGGFRWQGEASFIRWLARIAEHVVLDAARRKEKVHFISLDDMGTAEPAGDGPSPSKATAREERFDRLERAMGALPSDHRTVIRLVRLEGLPIDEVARRMSRSVNAVSHLLHRALRELRSSFGETDSFHLPDRRLARSGDADKAHGEKGDESGL
jgi:RNA polymerase sigma-70 factor (ECF subfamily)